MDWWFVAVLVLAAAALVGILLFVARGSLVEKRAYFAALAVSAVMLPGLAGAVTSVLYVLHERAGLTWTINDGGPRSFLYGSALSIALWLLVSPLFQRYGRVEESNPTEYARLLALYNAVRTRQQPLGPQAFVADSALDAAAISLRLQGADPSTRGILWASQGGYVVARASLESAERALLQFEDRNGLASAAAHLRARLDGAKMRGNSVLFETVGDMITKLEQPNHGDLDRVRSVLVRVQATLDDYRDSRRYGLVSARSRAYGTILLCGSLAYLVLGLALVAGAGSAQIIAGIVFYLVGAVIGLFRDAAEASSADTQIEEDYGLDDARLIQRPLLSGVAAVGGAALMTFGVVVASNNVQTANQPTTTAPAAATTTAPAATTIAQPTTPRAGAPTTTAPSPPVTTTTPQGTTTTTPPRQRAKELPSLDEIFDLDRNRLGIVFAAIFGLAPALLIARLQTAAEQFKVDLRSTEPGEQAT
jgi:hypothetical protein